MAEEEPSLIGRLRDGRELPISTCTCRHCQNEWFMASLSDEWMPSFCPYCGIKFIGKTTDGVPDAFIPANFSDEADRLRKAIHDAFNLFRTADHERLDDVHKAHAEAEKWKAEGDMYGWNFHQGKAGGMTQASIIFYRVFRRLKLAMGKAAE